MIAWNSKIESQSINHDPYQLLVLGGSRQPTRVLQMTPIKIWLDGRIITCTLDRDLTPDDEEALKNKADEASIKP